MKTSKTYANKQISQSFKRISKTELTISDSFCLSSLWIDTFLAHTLFDPKSLPIPYTQPKSAPLSLIRIIPSPTHPLDKDR